MWEADRHLTLNLDLILSTEPRTRILSFETLDCNIPQAETEFAAPCKDCRSNSHKATPSKGTNHCHLPMHGSVVTAIGCDAVAVI